ncbi:hypothetical protein MNBD_UNCLBAC01-1449 [hydrothermal vent metagenome]|uniref:N-acetyltransferase domain-containing protein n=1 Tax=hydrothermal vent metagenome TaxID=652676 RepID=A0A3B1D8G0_9ZZZZ
MLVKNKEGMNIRFAKKTDIKQIIELCEAHAIFEKSSYSSENKAKLLEEHLFHSTNKVECIVVEKGRYLVGYATFMKQFSTWDANHYIYLDCLFLKESVRGQNIGHKIMCEIKEYANIQNCKIIQWQTPVFNEKAIKFYEKNGAISKTKERFSWKC